MASLSPYLMKCLAAVCIVFWNFPADVMTENVYVSEMFSVKIEPKMFNWTFQGLTEQYSYRSSLIGYPDLPAWVRYTYSARHHAGFLYGTPPDKQKDVQIEIIALNRQNYETRRTVLDLIVNDKETRAKHEIQLKIDNLNVEDMLDVHRMARLMDVFRRKLWHEASNDMYVTFLESAVQMGARLPLKPNDGEGVVVRLGSSNAFSTELIELQEEVKPLFKLSSCPRDFKRTTVERLFREAGFALDWCAFRLVEDETSALRQHSGNTKHSTDSSVLDRWTSLSKDQVPERSYVHEFIFTIIVPMFVMIVLVVILSLILCFQYEGISARNKTTSPVQMVQYSTTQRPGVTSALRNLPTHRDIASDNLSNRSQSPSHSLNTPYSPRSNNYLRPQPPPYAPPSGHSEPKTLFC